MHFNPFLLWTFLGVLLNTERLTSKKRVIGGTGSIWLRGLGSPPSRPSAPWTARRLSSMSPSTSEGSGSGSWPGNPQCNNQGLRNQRAPEACPRVLRARTPWVTTSKGRKGMASQLQERERESSHPLPFGSVWAFSKVDSARLHRGQDFSHATHYSQADLFLKPIPRPQK